LPLTKTTSSGELFSRPINIASPATVLLLVLKKRSPHPQVSYHRRGNRQETEMNSRAEHCPREGVGDGADSVACG
jgi:hypothetical protein